MKKETTKEWLEKADAIVIECSDEIINPDSLVDVCPYNTKTKEVLINHQQPMMLKEAEKIKKIQIAKGKNLIGYYKSQLTIK